MEREKGRGEEGRGDGRGRGTLDVVRWPRRVVVYLFTFVVHYSTNSKKKPEFKLEKRRNSWLLFAPFPRHGPERSDN